MPSWNSNGSNGNVSLGGDDIVASLNQEINDDVSAGVGIDGDGNPSGDLSVLGNDLWIAFPTSGSSGSSNPGGLGDTASNQPTGARASDSVVDPEGNFVFCLEIDHIEIAHFYECSGIKTATEVFELVEGGMTHRVHKLPGQSRWDNLVFRYGVTASTTLMEWRDQVLQGNFGQGCRRSGSIVLKNNNMQEVRRYNFVDAWPVAWEGPSFSSKGAEVAVEMIELAHHGIYLSDGQQTPSDPIDSPIDTPTTPSLTEPDPDFLAGDDFDNFDNIG